VIEMAKRPILDFEMDMNDVKGIHKQVRVGECKDWKLPNNNRVHACRIAEDEVTAEHYQGAGDNEILVASFHHKKGQSIEKTE